jgi:ubiquilin
LVIYNLIMSDESAPTEEPPITFHVKSSGDTKYTLTLPLTTTIIDLKTKLATPEFSDTSADRLRLIYSGRVMKDPDTLNTYKVKENHTIHLVKSAQSNQRQNPASQGTAAPTTGGATAGGNTNQGIPGVPTNFAAGTGNNPLAGLTGARYAGFAQLPGAGMFGPDGGVCFCSH